MSEFVEPTRWYADLVLNGGINQGTDVLAAYIPLQLRQRSI